MGKNNPQIPETVLLLSFTAATLVAGRRGASKHKVDDVDRKQFTTKNEKYKQRCEEKVEPEKRKGASHLGTWRMRR